jgi:hypothetical protein
LVDYKELLQIENLKELYAKGRFEDIQAKKDILKQVYDDVNKEKMLLNATLIDYDTPEELAAIDNTLIDESDDSDKQGQANFDTDIIGVAFLLILLAGICVFFIYLKQTTKKRR